MFFLYGNALAFVVFDVFYPIRVCQAIGPGDREPTTTLFFLGGGEEG